MRYPFKLTIISVFLGLANPAQAHDPVRAEFTTADGVQIVGDYWTPIDMTQKAPVAVLLHMYNSNRQAWAPLVPALEEAGFAILAIDLRGHGESIKPDDQQLASRVRERDSKLFNAMNKDMAAAYLWLKQRPEVDLSRWVLVGASVGCSVALDYAGQDLSVDALVLMTPGLDYLGVDSAGHIKKYRDRPVLMLTSEEERSVGTDELATQAPGAEIKIFPQVDIHGTKMFDQVKGVETLIASYLKKHVGPVGLDLVYASMQGEVYYSPDHTGLKKIKPDNIRIFSSPTESQHRGLRPAK